LSQPAPLVYSEVTSGRQNTLANLHLNSVVFLQQNFSWFEGDARTEITSWFAGCNQNFLRSARVCCTAHSHRYTALLRVRNRSLELVNFVNYG
jgi:hypothetical protein